MVGKEQVGKVEGVLRVFLRKCGQMNNVMILTRYCVTYMQSSLQAPRQSDKAQN